jgi:ABC-type antimicrobial peptide transport system permease subunit
MSYFVTRRTREVGVRMALGADRRQVRRMVIARALAPVLLGLAGGVVLTLVGGRLAAALLPGISPRDPLAIGVAVAAIALSATAAAWWPAHRASRLDPIIALRDE